MYKAPLVVVPLTLGKSDNPHILWLKQSSFPCIVFKRLQMLVKFLIFLLICFILPI
jgi:hypothetical protein